METLVPSGISPDHLLTLTEVAQRTGWPLEALRGYVRDTPLNAHVQARPKPGSKGVGYPPESLDFFCKLREDALAKRVTPTTLTGWLDTLHRQPQPTENLPVVAPQRHAQPAQSLTLTNLLPPMLTDAQADRLSREVFNAQEAAAFLGVSPRALREWGPKPFMRFGTSARGDRWRKQDLLRGLDSTDT